MKVYHLLETNLKVVIGFPDAPVPYNTYPWIYSSNHLDVYDIEDGIRLINTKFLLEEDIELFGVSISSIYDLRII